jgi:tetratricopeptide (TPR) repeat protein
LLRLLERLKKRSINPWFNATFAHLSASEAFYQEDFEEARRWALIAGREYRHFVDQTNNHPRIMHLLGMINTKLERFPAAERHLRGARERYLKEGNLVNAIHTQHALAWVPYTAGDYARALDMLEDTVGMIDTLPEPATRESLKELISADIEKIRRRLRNGHL